MRKIGLVGLVLILAVLTVDLAQAAPKDWGPLTGYPTIDAWRRAGRQNDQERWERYSNDGNRYSNDGNRYSNGGNRYYSPNGNHYPYGYSQPSISITIPLPPLPWAR